jgi:hypothetical protein
MAEICAYCAGDAVEHCSSCGKPLCSDHTRKALPYLRLGDLLLTILRTLFLNPRRLPDLLFGEEEEKPFCQECYEENSRLRVLEQRKFFYLALGLALLCGLAIYLLVRFL